MKTTTVKTVRVAPKHIASEYGDSDGSWIDLKPGWKWAGDDVHSIHEDTRSEARSEYVLPCNCKSCKEAA